MENENKTKKLTANDWFELGKYHSSINNHRNAIEAYQKCVEKDPYYFQAWGNIAAEYFQLRKYQKSIKACKEAIKINPKGANLWLNLGANYFQINEDNKALFCFIKARELGSLKAKNFLERAKQLKDKLLDAEPIDIQSEIFGKKILKKIEEALYSEAYNYKVKSFRCPECGASLENIDVNTNIIKCKYCDEEFKRKILF